MTYDWIIGIDEVGRGPIAGPVTIGAFAFKANEQKKTESILSGIRDSKKLSVKKREGWHETIKEHCVYSISSSYAETVDEYGIVEATNRAIKDALEKIIHIPDKTLVLLDGGLSAPKEYRFQKTIIGGDTKEPAISAASVVAKVVRDQYMVGMAKTYPHYGFEKHKGYGTKAHREAIHKYGLSPMHRKTFCKNILNVQ